MGKVTASHSRVECGKTSKNIPTNLCADSNAILHPKVHGQIVIMKCMCATESGTSSGMLEQQGLRY